MGTPRDNPKVIPAPQTGQPLAASGTHVDEIVAKALIAYRTIEIPHKRQKDIRGRINTLRLLSLDQRGQGIPLDGRRLSQLSQAGKSFVLQQYAREMNTTPNAQGVINPYRVLNIELKESGTLKMLNRRILTKFCDPYKSVGNADDVELRVAHYMGLEDVELLIIDEIQHLEGRSIDKSKITDGLKVMLDTGVVPIVMAGNEDSEQFFEQNKQLAGRLGEKMELNPAASNEKSERVMFKSFCVKLGIAISEKQITRRKTDFSTPYIIRGLREASGGHVGRIMRIVGVAVEQAVRRNADYVEAYDLANAVDSFAIPNKYCTSNALLVPRTT